MPQWHGGRLGQASPLVVRQMCFNYTAKLYILYHKTNNFYKLFYLIRIFFCPSLSEADFVTLHKQQENG